ncbi:tetratricopeptide repeat protein [Nitrospirillum sp. BR 11164]|uniref:tetratricopeptide repeat protein n=1 Tax=Nitrospirillum sp. BR 11164 TaxID=3104324 RepID=UPI002AFFE44A|nr:tetratricopeptide repeat protein [Nitrospirillum sp. BR 11164]MEA1651390.1 tetratricopeptide repeat protein [Nitrospirillum sp. BR 11164]
MHHCSWHKSAVLAAGLLLPLCAAPLLGNAWANTQKGVGAFQRKDYPAALTELGPAADKGDGEAQTYLGWMYEKGLGVPVDYARAQAWYTKAAAQGHAHALNNLGSLYYLGNGVPKDAPKGIGLFRKAAKKGDAQAQMNLAMIYYIGHDAPKDDAEAAHWARAAARQGEAHAQILLARLYDTGAGLPRNPVLAYTLTVLSGDNPDAQALRTRLEGELSTAQKAEAQTLAKTWRPGQPLPTATRT